MPPKKTHYGKLPESNNLHLQYQIAWREKLCCVMNLVVNPTIVYAINTVLWISAHNQIIYRGAELDLIRSFKSSLTTYSTVVLLKPLPLFSR